MAPHCQQDIIEGVWDRPYDIKTAVYPAVSVMSPFNVSPVAIPFFFERQACYHCASPWFCELNVFHPVFQLYPIFIHVICFHRLQSIILYTFRSLSILPQSSGPLSDVLTTFMETRTWYARVHLCPSMSRHLSRRTARFRPFKRSRIHGYYQTTRILPHEKMFLYILIDNC